MPLYRPKTPFRKTERLLSMYEYLKGYIKENGIPPSNREVVAAGLASSTSVVRYYYDRMEDLGMITRIPKVSRGIRLISKKPPRKSDTIPTSPEKAGPS